MELLPHRVGASGLWDELGDRFHPLGGDAAKQMGSALIPIHGELPARYAGRLETAAAGTPWTLIFKLPLVAILYMHGADGTRFAAVKVAGSPSSTGVPITPPDDQTYTYTLIERVTGAYIAGINAKGNDKVTVGPEDLPPINDPGLPGQAGGVPQPGAASPIPADSPPMLVGVGLLDKLDPSGNKYVALRTQNWQKSTDSYSLPGNSKLAITLTQSSGLTSSSSELETFATSVGASASIGWGPVSASVSASMSRSTTTSQETTVTSETEATVVREYENTDDFGKLVFLWQLVDRLMVIRLSGHIESVVETLLLPAIPAMYNAVTGSPTDLLPGSPELLRQAARS